MGYKFIKLLPKPTEAADGAFVFKELVTRLTSPKEYQINISDLELPRGKHTITVKAIANGVWSDHSNSVKHFI